MKLHLAALSLICAFSHSGFCGEAVDSKKETETKSTSEANVGGFKVVPATPLTDAAFTAELKRARAYAQKHIKTGRKLAGRVKEDDALSCSFRDLRNRIIGGAPCPAVAGGTLTKYEAAAGSDQLAEIIEDVDNDAYYNKLDRDAQLLAAQLSLLKPLRGVLYRSRKLVEDTRLSHSLILTAIRLGSTGVAVYLPDKNWKAGLKYISDPYPGIERMLVIRDDDTFNTFVSTELENAVIKFRDRIDRLNFEPAIRFDAKVLFANSDYAADEDRYFSLGYPEKSAMLGGAHLALASIQAGKSYHWKGFFKTLQKVAEVYGYDAYGFSRIAKFRSAEGSTAEARVEQIREQKKLGEFRPEGRVHLKSAYTNLKYGIQLLKFAWEAVDGRGERFDNLLGINQFMDPRFFAPFTRITKNTFDNLLSLLDDGPVTSAIYQGEVVQVKVRTLFGFDDNVAPPNLQDFLPLAFDEKPYKENKNGYEYHNYLSGSPTHWNAEVYGRYFPLDSSEIEKGQLTDAGIKKRARVLNQTWGGFAIGGPLMTAIF